MRKFGFICLWLLSLAAVLIALAYGVDYYKAREAERIANLPDCASVVSGECRDYPAEVMDDEVEETSPSDDVHGFKCTTSCATNARGYDYAKKERYTKASDCDDSGESAFRDGCLMYVNELKAVPEKEKVPTQPPVPEKAASE